VFIVDCTHAIIIFLIGLRGHSYILSAAAIANDAGEHDAQNCRPNYDANQ
jgi:hypothetical protein